MVSTIRQGNITDWALAQFRTRYSDNGLAKWDAFPSVYAMLHIRLVPTQEERERQLAIKALERLGYSVT